MNSALGQPLNSPGPAGQLRTVSKLEKRVAAAVHLGFDRVVAPSGTKEVVSKALKPHVVHCRHVGDLVRFVRRNAPQAAATDDEDESLGPGMLLGSDGTQQSIAEGPSGAASRGKQRGRLRRRWGSKNSSSSGSEGSNMESTAAAAQSSPDVASTH